MHDGMRVKNVVLRAPIIRHVRFFVLRCRVYAFAYEMSKLGIGLGHPNPSDLEHLQAIWDGKA